MQFLNFGLVFTSALMAWKMLGVVTNSESPIVVVLSESMSPGFERGDILFLNMYPRSDPVKVGDICVFKVEGKDIPIVHRVLKVHEGTDGKNRLLTKGDNNQVHDRGLYNRGQRWLKDEDLVGRVRGYVPYLGMMTIWFNDYPKLKYAVIGTLGYFILSIREG